MASRKLIMAPGPVEIPPAVKEVMSSYLPHHRTPEFSKILEDVLLRVRSVFKTDQPVLLQASTGSGGMEAAVVNCFSPGDKVLVIECGKFGERWRDISKTYGLQVEILSIPWDTPVDPAQVEEILSKSPDIKGILCQACESSTGVLHPIEELCKITKNKKEVLLLVDAISALGVTPLKMDEWGIDVMVTGSQKAFMLPTGMAFISLSKKAWSFLEKSKTPKYYFDLKKELKANAKNQTRFSSCVAHILGLSKVLDMLLENGIDQNIENVSKLARATRKAVPHLGLNLYAKVPAPSVTSMTVPEGVDSSKVRKELELNYGITIAGGQGPLEGKLLRIGHMGHVFEGEHRLTLDRLSEVLNTHGVKTDLKRALEEFDNEISK